MRQSLRNAVVVTENEGFVVVNVHFEIARWDAQGTLVRKALDSVEVAEKSLQLGHCPENVLSKCFFGHPMPGTSLPALRPPSCCCI